MEKTILKSNFRAAGGLGIVFIALGITMQNYGLMGVGLAFLIMGLIKKKKAART
jgi:hypothetical protein